MGAAARKWLKVAVISAALVVWLVILRLALGLNGTPEARTLAALCTLYGLGLWGPLFLFSRQPVAARCGRFLLMTLTIGVLIGAMELLVVMNMVDFRHVFRVDRGDPMTSWMHRVDRELLHVCQPNLHFTTVQPNDLDSHYRDGEPVEFSFDQNGFRNPPNMTRADVVVVGDSFVAGARVRDDQVMTTRLARRWNRVVANLGQGGYGPQQEWAALRRYGLPLNPGLIIWMFYEGNDLADAKNYAFVQAHWDSYIAGLNSFVNRSFSHNILDAIYDHTSSMGLTATHVDHIQKGLFHRAEGDDIELLFGYPMYPLLPEEVSILNDLVRPTMCDAAAACKQAGVRLVVAYIPEKFRVYGPSLRLTGNDAIRGWQPHDLPMRFKDMLKEVAPEAQFVELTSALQARAAVGELVYFPRDTHWSPRGHEVAAEELAKVLKLSATQPTEPPSTQAAR